VRKIAEFLGRSLTDQQISNIVQQTRFDAMKKDPDVNFKKDSFVKVETKSLFFRKGTYTVKYNTFLDRYCRSK